MSAECLIETCENLVGVPSYHYQPVFAQVVRAAIEKFRPDAVAVELPATIAGEMDWLVSCWPDLAVSVSKETFIPCVSGDSIIEAYRLARQKRLPAFCVDLDVADPIHRSKVNLPSCEFASRVGRQQFLETTDALEATAGPPAGGDLAREAFMAQRLSELMKQFRCVMWVGGMAHWTRMAQRLRSGNFTGPAVRVIRSRTFRRAKLSPTALYKMTGRTPFQLARYAKTPCRYDEWQTVRALGLAACQSKADVTLRIAGHDAPADESAEPVSASVDVARMLIYARNFAASSGIREMPGLGELLTAASATLGNRYAGRLYLIAMRERDGAQTHGLPSLTYERKDGKQGYRLEGRWLTAEPYWPSPGSRSLWVAQQLDATRKMQAPYASVPKAKDGDPWEWMAYPSDETAYEAFVRYVLEHASLPDSQESKSFPFQAGLRDGVDVRDTIRHWKDGTVYVREQANAQLRITNAVIDFSNRSERSEILQGKAEGKEDAGWTDPSFKHVGSCSREASDPVLLQDTPCRVTLRRRDFSLVSLDCPNWLKDPTSGRTFYDNVILPLVKLRHEKPSDNLYGWLEIMFRFCARKVVAYYAAYAPSRRIKQIARRHRVRLAYIPLSRIPKPLLKLNRTFRFIRLTKLQREEFLKTIADQKNAWIQK